jgi:hypothetical protein
VDALIFDATGQIEHVSLPDIDLKTLTELSGNIVLKQPEWLQKVSGRATPPISLNLHFEQSGMIS